MWRNHDLFLFPFFCLGGGVRGEKGLYSIHVIVVIQISLSRIVGTIYLS